MTAHPKPHVRRLEEGPIDSIGLRTKQAQTMLSGRTEMEAEPACPCALCQAWPEISELLFNLVEAYNTELEWRDDVIESIEAKVALRRTLPKCI